MKALLPECILGFLFNEKKTIVIDSANFHKIFYSLKARPEYSDILKNIKFSGSPVNPYSEVLDEALFNLQFSGALSRKYPEITSYSTTRQFKQTYNNLKNDIQKDQVTILKEMSKQIPSPTTCST